MRIEGEKKLSLESDLCSITDHQNSGAHLDLRKKRKKKHPTESTNIVEIKIFVKRFKLESSYKFRFANKGSIHFTLLPLLTCKSLPLM